ncbi:MAG: reverse transcriptase family protein [Candidatus Thorarchaeota archaeon]
MTEQQETRQMSKADYKDMIRKMGKREFTLLKMQEYGFWPKDLPTPYERQKNETPETYAERKKLMKEYKKIVNKLADFYHEKAEINWKLRNLQENYGKTFDIDTIRTLIAKQIMKESIERRAKRKKQLALEKQRRAKAWAKKKKEEIVFVGKRYSSMLYKREINKEKLKSYNLPVLSTDKHLAEFLGIEYKKLRFLTYHRDVVESDHYMRFKIPKRNGGTRLIAAPKSLLKQSQRVILDEILYKIPVSKQAFGFLKGKSVVSGANDHHKQPALVINMDLENFFPTLTFERIQGMFHSFGYSGYISTLLAMLTTYCERIPIEVNGKIKYVATSRRILPQGSPASPMITNIICRRLDRRLNGLAASFGFSYTRYADDMSFSTKKEPKENIGTFCGLVYKIIKEEGFRINHKKTRYLRRNNRQEITGIVINNDEIGISRNWIRRFRAATYNANRLKFQGKLTTEIKNELYGMVAWVNSVNPKRYKNMIENALEVLNSKSEVET